MNTHLKGLIITALGVLFVVPDSLFVRLIDGDAASIAFWRGITAGSVILTGVLLFQGFRGIRTVAQTGRNGLLYTFLIAITAPGFVFAVSLTSVANVVFILASMPVFAAIFSWIFLGEAISKRMVLTMAGVFAGLGVIAWGALAWRSDRAWCLGQLCGGDDHSAAIARRLDDPGHSAGLSGGLTGNLARGAANDGLARKLAADFGAWGLYQRFNLPTHAWAALSCLGRGGLAHPARIRAGAPAGLGGGGRRPGVLGHNRRGGCDRRAVCVEPLGAAE
jgi:drug/metabolite transporter (DMT)-like permease